MTGRVQNYFKPKQVNKKTNNFKGCVLQFTVNLSKSSDYLYDFKTVIEKEEFSSFPCCRHCYRENDGSRRMFTTSLETQMDRIKTGHVLVRFSIGD